MHILLTGGAGFIGSHVAEAYLAAGHRVSVLDDLSSGKPENLPAEATLYRGSVEDADFLAHTLGKLQPDVVNHHAAQVSVVVSVDRPAADAARNVVGTVNLLEAVRQTPSVKKLIYASTGGAMYGNPTVLPCTEATPAVPVSPYGLSKHTAERYVWLLAGLAGIEATVLRYGNVFGPRQDPHGEAGVCAIFTQAMLEDRPVKIFGDGSQVRDYVYVGDVAAANLKALEAGAGQSYNIATGTGTSTQTVYETIKRATGYGLEAVRAPERAGEVQAMTLSCEKAARELGWTPETGFVAGIEKTVAWYRERKI